MRATQLKAYYVDRRDNVPAYKEASANEHLDCKIASARLNFWVEIEKGIDALLQLHLDFPL
jgi:hypothetical protein